MLVSCPNCRGHVDCTGLSGAVTCPHCHRPFAVASPQAPWQPAPAQGSEPAPAFEAPVASRRRPRKNTGSHGWLLFAVALLALLGAGGYALYRLVPPSLESGVLGVWEFEKETGGMFSEQNSDGPGPSVEFLPKGKMVMHNGVASLPGKWKLDRSVTPAAFEMNWDSAEKMSRFHGIELPNRNSLRLKSKTTITEIDASGNVKHRQGEVVLHFNRRSSPPPKRK